MSKNESTVIREEQDDDDEFQNPSFVQIAANLTSIGDEWANIEAERVGLHPVPRYGAAFSHYFRRTVSYLSQTTIGLTLATLKDIVISTPSLFPLRYWRRNEKLINAEQQRQNEVQHHDCLSEVEATISQEGGTIVIEGTGVELYVPPNALQEDTRTCFKIKIIPLSSVGEPAQSFAGNSSMVVELLPDRLSLRYPARLTLPHCLQLKKGTHRWAKVFVSHHEKGARPCWEEVIGDEPDHLYKLNETSCSIWLRTFCWVKYEVDDEIVEGKKIIIYAARKKYHSTQVDIGYYPTLSGEGEILRLNKDMIVADRKPLLFLKEGKKPLRVYFEKSVPAVWQYPETEENPMEISFRSIALSDERTLPFLLQKQHDVSCVDDTSVPTCLFKAWQDEKEKIHLTIPVEVKQEQQILEDPSMPKKKVQDVRKKTHRRQSNDTVHYIDTETERHEPEVRSPVYPYTERRPGSFPVETPYYTNPFIEYLSSTYISTDGNVNQTEEVGGYEEHLGAVGGQISSSRSRPNEQMEALGERFQLPQTKENRPGKSRYDERIMMPLEHSQTVANYPVQNQYYNISHVYYGSPGYMRYPMLLRSESGPHISGMFSLRFKTLNTIANRLDGPDVLGNNWQRLADELGFNLDESLAFQKCDSPTEALITTAIRMGKLSSVNQLRDLLKRINREDAAAALPCEEDQNISDNSNQID